MRLAEAGECQTWTVLGPGFLVLYSVHIRIRQVAAGGAVGSGFTLSCLVWGIGSVEELGLVVIGFDLIFGDLAGFDNVVLLGGGCLVYARNSTRT